MDARTWFDEKWRRTGEVATSAVYRLHLASGLSPVTLRRALAGQPLRRDSAERLAAATDGEVEAERLVFPVNGKSGHSGAGTV